MSPGNSGITACIFVNVDFIWPLIGAAHLKAWRHWVQGLSAAGMWLWCCGFKLFKSIRHFCSWLCCVRHRDLYCTEWRNGGRYHGQCRMRRSFVNVRKRTTRTVGTIEGNLIGYVFNSVYLLWSQHVNVDPCVFVCSTWDLPRLVLTWRLLPSILDVLWVRLLQPFSFPLLRNIRKREVHCMEMQLQLVNWFI